MTDIPQAPPRALCETCGGSGVESMTWLGGDTAVNPTNWRYNPCLDCRPAPLVLDREERR